MTWGTSARATSYEYCIGTTIGVCIGGWTNLGTYTLMDMNGLSDATTYYWHVRAVNAGGTTYADANTWWSFTTQVEKPPAFGKLTPVNGATGRSLTPTVSWQASAGATSYEVCGNVTASCAGSWTPVGNVTTVAWPGPALDPGTTYYWQVRAVNAGGVTGADDATWWHFTTLARPGVFAKTGPANGATGQATSLTVAWQASPDAASYQVLRRHDRRQRVRRRLEQCRRRDERGGERPGAGHDVLLAGARGERERHAGGRQPRVVELHDGVPAGGVPQDWPGQRRDGPAHEPDTDVADECARDELRVLRRHDERRRVRRDLDERGRGNARGPAGPGARHDVLLAGPGGERRRDARRRRGHVVGVHDAARACRVRQDRPGAHGDGPVDHRDARVGAECGRRALRVLRGDEPGVPGRVDQRRVGDQCGGERPDGRHDLRLAGAGRERGRDDRREQRGVVAVHDRGAGRAVHEGGAAERGGGPGDAADADVAAEGGGDRLRGVREHDAGLSVDDLAERGERDEHHAAGPGRGDDVLLAGAGGGVGRADGGERRHVVALHDDARGPSAVRQADPRERGDGRWTGRRADVGGERRRGTLRILSGDRRRMPRGLDERGHGDEHGGERARRRHDVLLAGPGGECGRADAGQWRHLVDRLARRPARQCRRGGRLPHVCAEERWDGGVLGLQRQWPGDAAGGDVHAGERGLLSHLRRAERRDGGVLGFQRLGPGDAAGGDVHAGERGLVSHLRRAERRDGRVLGFRRPWPGDAAGGDVHAGERGLLSHLRRAERRDGGVLGFRRLWPGDAAGGDVHAGERGRRSRLRRAERRDGGVLGFRRLWPGDAAGGDVHAGGRGRLPHVRRAERRHGRVLGLQRRGPGDAAGGDVHAGERGLCAHVRGPERRDGRVLGLQRLWQGDAAGGDVHAGERGRRSHLRRAERRHGRVLGLQRLWRGDAAGGDVHAGERGRAPHVRRPERRDGRLLGRRLARPGDAAGGDVHAGQRRRIAHLRRAERRHGRVLGLQRQWPGDAAGGDVHAGQRRRRAHLRRAERRHGRVLGCRRRWPGDAAGGDVHAGERGLLSHLRRAERRDGGVLGLQRPWPGDAAGGDVYAGERGLLSHLRRAERRDGGVLGFRRLWPGDAAGGDVHAGERGRRSRLRRAERRRGRVLGGFSDSGNTAARASRPSGRLRGQALRGDLLGHRRNGRAVHVPARGRGAAAGPRARRADRCARGHAAAGGLVDLHGARR